MGSELDSLKATLRSLVVSCPTSVDVQALRRDYRNMMGEHIPIAKYGYRDLVTFLKERCSDSFLLQGSPANPTVTLIVPDTLKHIDKFVRKQKIPSTAKFKGKRYSIQAVAPPKPVKSYVPVSKPIVNWPSDKNIANKENDSSNNTVNHKSDNNVVNQMAKLTIDRVDSNANGCRTEDTVESALPVVPDIIKKTTSVQKFLNKRLPQLASTIESHSNDEESSSSSQRHRDDDSGRLTASSGSSGRRRLLDEVGTELAALLAERPAGVWSTDLLRLYRERFHRELPFTRLGYTSVVSCVRALDVVRVERPELTGDWLIVPSWSPPQLRPLRPPRAPAAPASTVVDADDALPGIDFDTSVFPPDCIHCIESLPRLPLAAAAGDALPLCVSEVYSPSHCWVQLLGPDHRDALDHLMDQMTEYYSRGEGRERWLARGAVRAGHHCAAVFEADWHRALIVKVIDDDFVKVRL
ncbi:unnamed protein product [Plutella xylostella]|uniref:(diamondback moth) hypothetical protein n=1 Tax=Plutella xylostella TaxID=51655 RepID=A0A8S4GEB4_PLUXY|nr:unnamed protein product [Plutella xylostella]